MEKGTILDGKYEILKKIGEGGMSIVYLAMDLRLNKQWAVKEMKPGFDREFSRKILGTEAQVLRSADHPVLPRIVDILEEGGSFYIIMDYIEGRTMDLVLLREGAQPQEQVIEWGKQLCEALDYLHRGNPPVIYRDMKPSNIMKKPDGSIKLIDFGTAKEFRQDYSHDTTALGTRGYAAPEQFGDGTGKGLGRTDARTDIYCLGATLYHMVTGRSPAEPPYEVRPIRELNPALSGGLEAILLKCTRADPGERFQSCGELLQALRHYEKMDVDYRRRLRRNNLRFGACLAGAAASAMVSLCGYRGMWEDRLSRYNAAMVKGDNAGALGKYGEALESYTKAASIVKTRSEPYYNMLNIYEEMDKQEDGLKRVGSAAVNEEAMEDRDELLFEVAARYFFELEDYENAMKYFQVISKEHIPEAEYYYEISKYQRRFVRDGRELVKELKGFESYMDGAAPGSREENGRLLINCRLLASIYASNLEELNGAFQEVRKYCERGLYLAEALPDAGADKAAYITDFNRYLSLAWEWKGDHEREERAKQAAYEQAADYCKSILNMTSSKEDFPLREQKLCALAGLYAKMGKYKEAESRYQEGLEELGHKSRELWIAWLNFLCAKEEKKNKNPAAWDRKRIEAALKEGSRLKGMAQDIRWKRLLQKVKMGAL